MRSADPWHETRIYPEAFMEGLDMKNPLKPLKNEQGALGYLFAWFLGVPATVLILIFLIRGN